MQKDHVKRLGFVASVGTGAFLKEASFLSAPATNWLCDSGELAQLFCTSQPHCKIKALRAVSSLECCEA